MLNNYDAAEHIRSKIKEENDFFQKYMRDNPGDSRRVHDHEVITAVYTELLHELK